MRSWRILAPKSHDLLGPPNKARSVRCEWPCPCPLYGNEGYPLSRNRQVPVIEPQTFKMVDDQSKEHDFDFNDKDPISNPLRMRSQSLWNSCKGSYPIQPRVGRGKRQSPIHSEADFESVDSRAVHPAKGTQCESLARNRVMSISINTLHQRPKKPSRVYFASPVDDRTRFNADLSTKSSCKNLRRFALVLMSCCVEPGSRGRSLIVRPSFDN